MYRKNNIRHQRGFSLVELVLVLAILGILLSIATFQFSQYSRKSAMEKQTKTLFVDILNLRNRALYEKRNKAIVVSSASYSLYSTDATTAAVAPVMTQTLRYPVVRASTAPARIVFDTMGVIQSAPVAGWAFCISETNSAAVDSVALFMTSVQSGKLTNGASCDAYNIKAK